MVTRCGNVCSPARFTKQWNHSVDGEIRLKTGPDPGPVASFRPQRWDRTRLLPLARAGAGPRWADHAAASEVFRGRRANDCRDDGDDAAVRDGLDCGGAVGLHEGERQPQHLPLRPPSVSGRARVRACVRASVSACVRV